jgi:8-oxo-dGTP diphosphatase
MKNIEVVAAIIKDKDRILATQRGYGAYAGYWEFPGGKVEKGENREEALHREIAEELEVKIEIDSFLQTVDYTYPEFHLIMHCFMCHISEGAIRYVEHSSGRWLTKNELDLVKWLPADLAVVERLKDII